MGDEEIRATLEGQDGSTVSMTLRSTPYRFTIMNSIGLDYTYFKQDWFLKEYKVFSL